MRIKKNISIIIPCFNEAEVISETIKRLQNVTHRLMDYKFELLLIDDGSKDNTKTVIKKSMQTFKNVRLISFSRNFGHQIAVTAGIDYALGDAVVLIDADLQDPPELIELMIKKWEEGNEVVYGTRTQRHGESFFKKITAKFFYKFLNSMSDVVIPNNTGDFRLMDRRIVNILKDMPERHRFVRGMISWIGFRQTSVFYERQKRYAGESKYPFLKMLKFGMDGILSFSNKPLMLAMLLGFISSFISIIVMGFIIWSRLYSNDWVKGWTALMFTTLFFGGVQLIAIGILGEYVGRIYVEAKGRPIYIIDENI